MQQLHLAERGERGGLWRVQRKKRGGEERRTGVLSNADDESLGREVEVALRVMGRGEGAEGGALQFIFSHSESTPTSPLLSLCVTAGGGNVKGRTKKKGEKKKRASSQCPKCREKKNIRNTFREHHKDSRSPKASGP